jgi:hypothetical protein
MALYYVQCRWTMLHALQVCPHRKHYGISAIFRGKIPDARKSPTAFPAVAAFIQAFQKLNKILSLRRNGFSQTLLYIFKGLKKDLSVGCNQ